VCGCRVLDARRAWLCCVVAVVGGWCSACRVPVFDVRRVERRKQVQEGGEL
jgi:hypothetical protein